MLQNTDPIVLRSCCTSMLTSSWPMYPISPIHLLLDVLASVQLLLPAMGSSSLLQLQRQLAILASHMRRKADEQLHLIGELIDLQQRQRYPISHYVCQIVSVITEAGRFASALNIQCLGLPLSIAAPCSLIWLCIIL